jgi:xylan 1,4-beta-xylosidase
MTSGGLAIAAWNLVDPDQHGTDREMDLHILGVPANAEVKIQRVDHDHGNVLPQWAAMGKPKNPTPAQAERLNRETALPAPEQTALRNGVLHLKLSQNALVLIRVDGTGR